MTKNPVMKRKKTTTPDTSTIILNGSTLTCGLSGTSTKKRTEFQRMIDDCMAGKIDMVITKSISRFARNTVDCLQYIRMLKEKGIPVIFEKENINSMDAKGEIMLTIMASLAQQESQSISENVKMGIAFRNQNGEVRVNTSRFLGYTSGRDEEGKKILVVVPEEAEIVKRIFREYLEGASLQQIANGLEADGKVTGAGKTKWPPNSLRNILQNEKYIGDALLAKTYTVDFLSKKRVINTGEVPQYYVENSHQGIIPRDIFMQTQEELARRANLRNRKNGGKRVFSPTIAEADLHNVVMQAINSTLTDKAVFNTTLRQNIELIVGKLPEITVDIDARLEELQRELIRLSNNHDAYDGVVDEIMRLREQKQEAMTRTAEQDTL